MDVLTRLPGRHIASRWLCQDCLRKASKSAAASSTAGNEMHANKNGSIIQKRRHFRSSRIVSKQPSSAPQAHPLGEFYADLLATPIPEESTASSDLPTFVRSGDETKDQRAAKLFGNIRGSGYERKLPKQSDSIWKTINGVPIPPRPEEPENCCMSGCMHCVWDDYRDDIEEWAKRLQEAQAKGTSQGTMRTPKIDLERAEVANASGSMDDDGGGSEALWDAPSAAGGEGGELFAGIPVGIREFMATEKKIRERKKARKGTV